MTKFNQFQCKELSKLTYILGKNFDYLKVGPIVPTIPNIPNESMHSWCVWLWFGSHMVFILKAVLFGMDTNFFSRQSTFFRIG